MNVVPSYLEVLDRLPDGEQFERAGLDLNKEGLVLYAASQIMRHGDEESMAWYVLAARRGDPFLAKVLDRILEYRVAKNLDLTGALGTYAIDKVEGRIKPRGGKSKNTNFLRDLIIRDAVEALMKEISSENKATLIVAMELNRRGYKKINHEAVRAIMKKAE